MSFRWKQAEAPAAASERSEPASTRFSDQLIAVLPRLRRFARGLTGSAAILLELDQLAPPTALGYSVAITPFILLVIGVYLLLPARSRR